MKNDIITKRLKRKKRVRSRISGEAQKPRLSVFKSSKHIYAQLIDDELGETLVSASDLDIKPKVKKTKKEIAKLVGIKIAEKAKIKKIEKVVFDRSQNKYHGRIKELADGARSAGLKF